MLKKTVCLLTTILALTLANSAVLAQENPFMSLPDNRKLNLDAVSVDETLPPDFLDYGANLQNQINSNWYPKTSRSKRDATVLLTISPDGSVEGIKIQKSSNKKKFDTEICDSILRAVPFDALPQNLATEAKNVQLNFVYDKDALQPQMVIANIKNQPGYDEYISKVEKTVANGFAGKKYFCKKDVLLEMNLTKKGEVRYAKIINASLDDNFIKTEFNRKTLIKIQSLKMPPIPDKMGVDDITVDYRILTQRKRKFINFLSDYAGNCFRTDLDSYSIQKIDSL